MTVLHDCFRNNNDLKVGRLCGAGGTGATTFHNELQALIQQSTSLTDFNTRLSKLVTRWNIKPNLPPLIK